MTDSVSQPRRGYGKHAGSNDFRSSCAKVIYAQHRLAPFEFDIHRGWRPSALRLHRFLTSPRPTNMKSDRREEPPARRLGILYVASFCMIALLSGISQTLILRELSWQTRAISSVAHAAKQQLPGDSLSVLATSILAASEPRRAHSARELIPEARSNSAVTNLQVRRARALRSLRHATQTPSRPACNWKPRHTTRVRSNRLRTCLHSSSGMGRNHHRRRKPVRSCARSSPKKMRSAISRRKPRRPLPTTSPGASSKLSHVNLYCSVWSWSS